MTYHKPARPSVGWVLRLIIGSLFVSIVVLSAVLIFPMLPSSSATISPAKTVLRDHEQPTSLSGNDRADGLTTQETGQPTEDDQAMHLAPPIDVERGVQQPAPTRETPDERDDDNHTQAAQPPMASPAPELAEGTHRRIGEHQRMLGVADGTVPDGTTIFDDQIPGVANLDPDFLAVLRLAATDARKDGIVFLVNSGWRSPQYQEQLLREAVSEYGSAAEAARWVATPATSAHVSGNAVDLGPVAATAWLSQHGAAYGLCQVYGNEPWHFELRPDAIAQGCPPMYPDPTYDPRLQQ